MVGNTPKMMFRASKIDQGMAKEITRKFERIFKNFSSFWLLQSGLCNSGFAFFLLARHNPSNLVSVLASFVSCIFVNQHDDCRGIV